MPVCPAEIVALLTMLPRKVPPLPVTFVILRPTRFGALIVPLLAMLPAKVPPLVLAMLKTTMPPSPEDVAVTAPLLVMLPKNRAGPTFPILMPVFADTVPALTMLPRKVPLLPAAFVNARPTALTAPPPGAVRAPLLMMLPAKVAPLALAMLETTMPPAPEDVAVRAALLVMFPENKAAPMFRILMPVLAETTPALTMLPRKVPLLPATLVIERPAAVKALPAAVRAPLLTMLPAKVAPLALAMLKTRMSPVMDVAVMAPLLLMVPENNAAPTFMIAMPFSAAEIEAVLTMLPLNVPLLSATCPMLRPGPLVALIVPLLAMLPENNAAPMAFI